MAMCDWGLSSMWGGFSHVCCSFAPLSMKVGSGNDILRLSGPQLMEKSLLYCISVSVHRWRQTAATTESNYCEEIVRTLASILGFRVRLVGQQ